MGFLFLSDRQTVVKRLTAELKTCKRAAWAVAWTTERSDVFEAAMQHAGKFKFLLTGTTDWITAPQAISAMRDAVGDKFRVLEPDRQPMFHSKMYLFTDDVRAVAIIGSHNLTRGAFHRNDEACVAIEAAHGDEQMKKMWKYVSDVFTSPEAQLPDDGWLFNYSHHYAQRKQATKPLKEFVAKPKVKVTPPLLQGLNLPDPYKLDWPTYADFVFKEDGSAIGSHTFDGRAKVLEKVKELFANATTFAGLPPDAHERIAGTVRTWPASEPNWHWFGAMKSPPFRASLAQKTAKWSDALEAIPATGLIEEHHYRQFLQEDPAKGDLAIPARSRLLAMKRPDVFVCVSERNSVGLARAFGFGMEGGALTTQTYWPLIERIRETPWWRAERPIQAGDEQRLWDGRAAFLDALYYVPKQS
ncbi:HKD family nuclease [Variovorax boronicumulans]|uniref:phospholipase D-like domain-containing protein n=1 Tax=Variovorax boronicumulans TaxID=436515 RepID=UPI002788A5C4|nr:phospholipase D-like domain-containing protein [Variovorax boronicumulans]MDQ0036072.1 HKD family nuclease [Variovorax boronicumulans]